MLVGRVAGPHIVRSIYRVRGWRRFERRVHVFNVSVGSECPNRAATATTDMPSAINFDAW
ncbi:hypothetical protein [Tessaracoccus defluvii]|uniref:Uncharacterized protein n=1 Tax=Tessaracoccus defluvii TaxID=1285901 RepID=A0A7H0H6Z0_9ACTN|nr:hypothetical protein [Tessaracoccus defluvii]QNP56306.1 hypothetical protein H9L22_02185 [Tessaracoccus defluvii]